MLKREPAADWPVEKTAPPAPAVGRLARGRLLAGLSESLKCCSATVISGRAGTGKTTLAGDFARGSGRAAAWYTVEAPDAELPVFFKYLCGAVARRRPGFGAQALWMLGDGLSAGEVDVLVECFVSELLCLEEPLLVVVDDLHFVYDEEWTAPFFARLLPLLPREVHFILVGRGLPPAPLWRMRSKQTLCVLEEPALAFTLHEAQELFTLYSAPNVQAAAAWHETRGRAAALADRAAALAAAQDAASERTRHARRPVLVKGFATQ